MTPVVRMPTCELCGTGIAARCRLCLGWYCRDCTTVSDRGVCWHKRYEPLPDNPEWEVPPTVEGWRFINTATGHTVERVPQRPVPAPPYAAPPEPNLYAEGGPPYYVPPVTAYLLHMWGGGSHPTEKPPPSPDNSNGGVPWEGPQDDPGYWPENDYWYEGDDWYDKRYEEQRDS